jgi:electron transfer flavoprotein alpha subunit
LSAAQKLGFPITALVASSEASIEKLSKSVAQFPGVTKVLAAKGKDFDHELAEPLAELISKVSKGHSHVVTAHSGFGKNVFPRAGALLDVSPIPDVIAIESADTFKRPIYAGRDPFI